MPSVYITPKLEKLLHLYGDILYTYDISIKKRLLEQANILWQALQNRNEIACIEINNYHPAYLGQKPQALFSANLSFITIQETIAAEYAFQSWENIERLGSEKLNFDFEKAVDTLLTGDLSSLKQQVKRKPELLTQTSQYPHKASLLHYVASNGVEIHRQVVPNNLPEITNYLLENGTNPDAKMKVYGGAFTTLELLKTSAHPANAGILEEMKACFIKGKEE